MKNRLLRIIICISMFIAALPTASAAFSDTDGHWAQEYITTVVEQGLFTGTDETTFSPEMTMSRAMFITVLGRLEEVDATLWTHSDLLDVPADAYYAPYVAWACASGIVNGVSETEFAPDAPVTREQMAKIIAFYAEKMGYRLKAAEDVPESFADADDISEWAAESVEMLRTSGILNGTPNADGSVSFCPQETATRAQAAAVFCRIRDAINREVDSPLPETPSTLTLNMYEASLTVGETCQLIATVEPEDTITYASSDETVLTVDENGFVTCIGTGQASITATTGGGLSASCVFTCEEASVPPENYPNASYSYADKCSFLFGEYVDEHRYYYNSVEAAKADMQKVTVTVWDISQSGEKYTKTMTVEVHKNLAPTVAAIFDEIYHGEEKFPISYLGGWSWSGKSEHTIGTAIDINYPQNYYCDPNGNAIVGDYWKPDEDPYSIKPDGDVVRAFEKYGFRWGVNWNSGYKDYMHFSFFGT